MLGMEMSHLLYNQYLIGKQEFGHGPWHDWHSCCGFQV